VRRSLVYEQPARHLKTRGHSGAATASSRLVRSLIRWNGSVEEVDFNTIPKHLPKSIEDMRQERIDLSGTPKQVAH
jgi:hypothetical protein